MFDEISLKLRQMNWNVAINNVNVVADELSSQRIIYTCLTTVIWTQQVLCALVPFAQNGGLLGKLAPKAFNFTMDIPSLLERA